MTWHHNPASAPIPAQEGASKLPLCAVKLIDRRTGSVLRVNGAPLMAISKHPHEAAAELLDGRDPRVWEARIEHLPCGGPL